MLHYSGIIRMKPWIKLAMLLITASLTSPAFSQASVECTSDPFGGTYCSGPGGYQAQGQRYTGGIESWSDNRGNQADVQHHSFGRTSINANRTSSDTLNNILTP